MAQTYLMDEYKANQLFDTAVYLAYKSLANPTDETILSLFGWLVYKYDMPWQALLH